MEETISIVSDGLRIAGVLTVPEAAARGPRPAILILHGFGGHRNGPQQKWSRRFFNDLGYVTLSIDFRGCGDSEGARGAIVPSGMVNDAIAAVHFLRGRPEVDPARVALSGTSYGATVAVYAAGICPENEAGPARLHRNVRQEGKTRSGAQNPEAYVGSVRWGRAFLRVAGTALFRSFTLAALGIVAARAAETQSSRTHGGPCVAFPAQRHQLQMIDSIIQMRCLGAETQAVARR